METEFIYWRHRLPIGINVEEVSGGADRKGELWRQMALQIYCENGRDGYRQIGHYSNGAPFPGVEPQRISITHTEGLLAVASLPRTPEANLSEFSPRTAMGIDAERADRAQVLKVREKFLSAEEMEKVAADDVAANILAWTAKEALYKAAMTPGLDTREDLRIISLPEPLEYEERKGERPLARWREGEAEIRFKDGAVAPMSLFAYPSDEFLVTVAYSPKCAKFGGLKDA